MFLFTSKIRKLYKMHFSKNVTSSKYHRDIEKRKEIKVTRLKLK